MRSKVPCSRSSFESGITRLMLQYHMSITRLCGVSTGSTPNESRSVYRSRANRLRPLLRYCRRCAALTAALPIERISGAVARQVREFFAGKSEFLPRQLVLACERAAEQRGVIGIQDDRYAGGEQPPDWMLRQGRHRSGTDVAADTNLQWNIVLAQVLEQMGILDGADA